MDFEEVRISRQNDISSGNQRKSCGLRISRQERRGAWLGRQIVSRITTCRNKNEPPWRNIRPTEPQMRVRRECCRGVLCTKGC